MEFLSKSATSITIPIDKQTMWQHVVWSTTTGCPGGVSTLALGYHGGTMGESWGCHGVTMGVPDAVWCGAVLSGAVWCRLALAGDVLCVSCGCGCLLVLSGLALCCMVAVVGGGGGGVWWWWRGRCLVASGGV